MAIGEAGSIVANSAAEEELIRVELSEALTNPVFALTATSEGGEPFSLRVVDQEVDEFGNATSFSFVIEEWQYLDGEHAAPETINWLAVEEGVHELSDGRVIEAGAVQADHTDANVALNGDFPDPPVVLTSVLYNNDATTVDSDPLNITSDGFSIRLQEEEREERIHGVETVGFIAIQPGGGGVGGTTSVFNNTFNHNTDTFDPHETFDDGVILADTQTIWGGDTARVVIQDNTDFSVDLSLEEERSRNGEETGINSNPLAWRPLKQALLPA